MDFSVETPMLQNQSGEIDVTQSAPYKQEENVEFTDADPGYEYNVEDYVDPTRTLQDSDDASLQNFFSRPLKVASYQWTTTSTFGEVLDPWRTYWENPRVANRIANYKLLRCKMRLKIVVNGTQFHYGRAIAAYEPLEAYNQTSPVTSLIRADIVRASQLPHIFIDPTSSQGGEIELPFFFHKNYLNIPGSEWRDMGLLYLREVNELKHANGATNPVTVSVFAWAEDVSFSVLTSREQNTLDPQAGEKPKPKKKKQTTTTTGAKGPKKKVAPGMSQPNETQEANASGMISGPATAVAKVAGALKAVPFLTPFATATEMAANTTAGIAKLFGYSRPTVTVDPEPFKPFAISSLATTTTPDGCEKLTVDDKQELTLDTRIAGVGSEDPLSIKSIASRESWLTSFTWGVGDAPETLLWNCRVSPVLWKESGTGPGKAYHLPACAAAALPFEFWSGSMTFRFQVVKSNFHKGRIKLVYDPEFLASNEYNTNYLHIIDITEKTDFSITIGHGQEKTLLRHLLPGLDGLTEGYSTTVYSSKGPGNGVLGVYIVNELAVPNTTINNDIEINVFVSMGDDFEVYVPVDDIMNYQFYRSSDAPQALDNQSGEVSPTSTENVAFVADEQDNMPVQLDDCELGPGMQDDADLNKVYTGEAIESFRPLLKRYNLWNIIGPPDSNDAIIFGRWSMFPYYRGYVPGAVNETDPGDDYNYCNSTLLHWVTMGFQGWRGSIRWKFLPRGDFSYCDTYVQRHPHLANDSQASYNFGSAVPFAASNANRRSRKAVKTNTVPTQTPTMGMNGHSFRSGAVNRNVEFEMPFYNDERFYPGKQVDYTSAVLGVETFDFRVFCKGTANAAEVDVHVAAGDDFQVYMWTGMPRIYYEVGPPLAA
jgi:hypothetical protein